jgi:hypothetical protein
MIETWGNGRPLYSADFASTASTESEEVFKLIVPFKG